MGIPKNQFLRTKIPQELICVSCKGVLDFPVNCAQCELIFCEVCSPPCKHRGVRPVSNYLQAKLDQLVIRCKNSPCESVYKLQDKINHEEQCIYAFSGSKIPICKTCGGPKEYAESHSCVDYLRQLNESQDLISQILMQNIEETRQDIDNMKEKSMYVKTTTERKLQELELAVSSAREELAMVEQAQKQELNYLNLSNEEFQKEYKNQVQGSSKAFLRQTELLEDIYTSELLEGVKSFMSNASQALNSYHKQLRENFMSLHS